VIVVGDKVYEFTPTTTRSVRKSKGKHRLGRLPGRHRPRRRDRRAVRRRLVDQGNDEHALPKRSLRPDEHTPDYPEEVEHGNVTQRNPKRADPADPEPGARFGDDAPF
jgi:hypothetical protein